MANTLLTPSIVAKEALRILDNNCVMGKLVYRGYESEFDKSYNGYEVGTTISVRRPTDFTVRSGRTASIQDVVEGSFPLKVDTQIGIDFNFTSQQLTQSIGELSDRVIKPAVVQLANKIDADCLGLWNLANNWVGATTTTAIDSFSEFAKAPERLDLSAVPMDDRSAVLSPSDTWAMLGSQTALYMQDVARGAYRNASLGQIGGIDTYMSQNVQTNARATATTATAHSNSTTYAASLNSNTATLGLTFLTTQSIEAGAVFTISGTFAVNPVTKATQSYLQNFVVISAAGGTGTVTVTITPPIITSGAFQTVSAAPASGSAVTFVGAASTSYPQNLVFHKNAIALCVVPMIKPPGAVDVSRQSYKGYSVRVIPYFDGTSDISNWRLDLLYGFKLLDPRLITRVNGTA